MSYNNKKRSKKDTSLSDFSDFHFATRQTEESKDKEYNDVKEVNEIGARYSQNPTPKDAEILIKAFHGFLMKYVKLLTPGNNTAKYITNETKHFLSLFIQRKQRSSAEMAAAYKEVASRLPNMVIQTQMSADDIYNELVCIFLEKAQKFKPEIGGFTGYIQYHFKYSVKSKLFELQNNALNFQPMYEETLNEDAFFGYDVDMSADDVIRVQHGHDLIDDRLVDLYIDLPALTPKIISMPPHPFDKIWTKQERAILVKIYYEDKSFSVAADELDYSNSHTVRNLHDNAISKYREFIKNRNI